MKRILIAAILSFSVLAIVAKAQQSAHPPLTNASVIKLVKAGFKEKTLIRIIHNRPSAFNLDPEQLIELKRQGVTENVILAMLASQGATFIAADDDEWTSDDQFFKGMKRPNSGGSGDGSTSSLFGSGGSSKSQNKSGIGQAGNENEGNVTGTATVRIIKPPAEAGGATSAKLEKTPTLNNEGVIRLVEAGFSEGTIIKRIEESPVDFDLSPGKLDELYKKRVTDAIVAAMKAAMGGDTKP